MQCQHVRTNGITEERNQSYNIPSRKHTLTPLLYSKTRVYLGINYFSYFCSNMKYIRGFLSENFQFLEVKFSMYLNRRVFVMLIKLERIHLTDFMPFLQGRHLL